MNLGDQSSIWNEPTNPADITQGDIADILGELDRQDKQEKVRKKTAEPDDLTYLTSFQRDRDLELRDQSERKTSSSGGSSHFVPTLKTQVEKEVSRFFSKNEITQEKEMLLKSTRIKTQF